jgi:hypothetical protein
MPTNSFRWLCSPESTRKCAEWDHGKVILDKSGIDCPVDATHGRIGSGKRLTDLSVTLPRGPVQDFVWTWYSECLIQDRVLDLFRREGFTGFEVKPVKARFKKGTDEPPRLWELIRTGWAGLARPESGIKRTYFCDACKHVRYSDIENPQQLIDESQWDGSDFFMVWPLPNFIFVSQRVADCLRDHRLSGVVVKRADEYEKNPAVIEGFGPGRLSYWMSEDRARQLGTALGIEEI